MPPESEDVETFNREREESDDMAEKYSLLCYRSTKSAANYSQPYTPMVRDNFEGHMCSPRRHMSTNLGVRKKSCEMGSLSYTSLKNMNFLLSRSSKLIVIKDL